MKLQKLARALKYTLQDPRESVRSILRSGEVVQAKAFADRFAVSESGAAGNGGPDPRCAGVENPLRDYFESHREGRGLWKWTHYFEAYQRHLSKFVGRSPHVVEIGIYSGGSLDMWRSYFGAGCRISGIDIEEACLAYRDRDVAVFIGDQADRGFWEKFRRESPPIDVVIDDGGHTPEQQRITLEETLPYLRPGGVFLCEDIHDVGNPFARYVQKLEDSLHAAHWVDPRKSDGGVATATTPFQQMIHSIHTYPFLTVIERTDAPVHHLRAPKHGTEWQPFL